MFTGFFYLLRAHGFRVSLNEWMTLIEGLMLDLQHDSLTGFFYVQNLAAQGKDRLRRTASRLLCRAARESPSTM